MNPLPPYSRRLAALGDEIVHVAFIGSGPGDPGLMTVRARDYLAAADVVILDHFSGDELINTYCRPDVVVVPADTRSYGDADAPVRVARLLAATSALPGGRLVVRLMDGDPAFFEGLPDECRALREVGIGFDIVPGVTAISAVPTYAGVPLTSESVNVSGVHIVASTDMGQNWRAAAGDTETVVILGCTYLRQALAHLREAGRHPKTPVAIVERGSTVEQATWVFDLGKADAFLDRHTIHPLAVAVISKTVAERRDMSWFETKPLFGWRVLVPRTKDQAGPMVERLASYGAAATVVPTIGIEPPRTPQRMERAVKDLVAGRYAWVAFTSVNSVTAVREKFEEFGLDVRNLAGLRVASVGGVTAAALRSWGIIPDLMPDHEESTAGLLEVWPDFDPDVDPLNGVFLPRADIATDALLAGLAELGWEADDVTAYRTVRAAPPPAHIREAIKTGQFDAVLFTSSSTVRNLIGIAGKPHVATVVGCIGKATAQTARDHGLEVKVVPDEASAKALVDALADHGEELARTALAAKQPLKRPSQRRRRRSVPS